MSGNVFIANISGARPAYTVNNCLLQGVGRPMAGNFTPYFVLTGISKYPDQAGSFCYGNNTFSVLYDDQLAPHNPAYQLSLPDGLSLNDNQILYVFRNSVLLVNERGETIGTPGGHAAPVT